MKYHVATTGSGLQGSIKKNALESDMTINIFENQSVSIIHKVSLSIQKRA